MGAGTYRLIVLATVLSSFMVGLHVPAIHQIMEHGATARVDILIATAALVVLTMAGTVTLLRRPR